MIGLYAAIQDQLCTKKGVERGSLTIACIFSTCGPYEQSLGETEVFEYRT